MIFKFTEEEQKQIIEFEQRAKAAGIGPEDFKRGIEDFEEISEDEVIIKHGKANIDKISAYSELREEFVSMLCKFESDHFEKLQTEEQIIEDAKEKTKEALIYAHNSSVYQFREAETAMNLEITIRMSKLDYYSFFRTMIYLSAAYLIDCVNEKERPPFFLQEKEPFLKCLKKYVINQHFEKLKGQPGAKILRREIANILDESKYIYHEKEKKEYRTAAKAKEAGAITEAPKKLIVPTLPNYQYSMSLYQGKNAYLQPLSSMDNLNFKDGTLYFKGIGAKEVSEAELRDLRTNEGIENLDLISLRYYYSILFDQFQRSDYKVLQDIIVVGVPLLAGRKNPKDRDIEAVIANLKSYHNVMGVIKGIRNGKVRESYYQVLNFEYYDEKRNIVAFSSPYMNYVIKNIYNLSLRRENGRVQVTSTGKPLMLPTHSYLIDKSIVKERNKTAAENVIIIVGLIEQAGNNEPHIKASTLVERNVQLSERLKSTKNPRVVLERTFKKTWELLRTKTYLLDVYENIKLPEPEDPSFMPTMKTLDTMTFSFPHSGKKK